MFVATANDRKTMKMTDEDLDMFTQLVAAFLLLVALIVIEFCMAGFIVGSINPATWTVEARGALVGAGTFFNLCIIGMTAAGEGFKPLGRILKGFCNV